MLTNVTATLASVASCPIVPPVHLLVSIMHHVSLIIMIILMPIFLVSWVTESYPQRARRWRQSGMSVADIAARLNVSPYKVRKYYLA